MTIMFVVEHLNNLLSYQGIITFRPEMFVRVVHAGPGETTDINRNTVFKFMLRVGVIKQFIIHFFYSAALISLGIFYCNVSRLQLHK